jgi:cell division protease FtsH
LSRFFRSALFPLILIVLLVYLASQTLLPDKDERQDMPYSQLIETVRNEPESVRELVFDPDKRAIEATLGSENQIKSNYPSDEAQVRFQALLQANDVPFDSKGASGTPWWSFLTYLLPFVLFFAFWIFLMNQVQGGGSKVMSFGKSRAKRMAPDSPKITFKDVAGVDEAVEELHEIKEFLENPKKFQALGARIPKGVLLYGPPGTGKTLLARSVAGEAGVPFFSISGSDFVEMFVGVGASRVRDLFEQAKQASPCIIFMDEIDAVGRHRGAGLGGGHDEREQTLNQLLVEMDGFDVRAGVILIAATNRPDILDPALLRPGRFDRQIVADRPDLNGRVGILKVHTRGKPVSPEVDLEVVARRTPGFTGADLANVVNEAALLAARFGKHEVNMVELEEAIDRVLAGPERRSRVISEKEKRVIAYHEAGHALVSHALPNADPVHKVSIVSRGRALGYTLTLPTEDRFLVTRSELIDELAMLLGGRVAEEVVFNEPTTGAADDIQRATQIAKQMVTQYGMSDLGPLKFGESDQQPFLGRDYGHLKDYSDVVAGRIDSEITRFVEEAHDEAREIVTKYREKLDLMVERLLEKESIEKEEVAEILAEVAKQSPPDPTERARRRRRAREEAEAAAAAAEERRKAPRPRPKPRLGEI